MEAFSAVYEVYRKFNYDLADARTNDLPLVSSPFKLLGLIGLYLWFCLKAGPHFMRNRKPYKLRRTLMIYNIIQVLISAYFFKVTVWYWMFKFSYKCEPVDYSLNPDALYVARMCHIYFVTKILELLDTVFFVLRKKYSQVSTLHLYHHSFMVAMTWLATKYFAGGQSTFVGLLNSFVHIIMYSYYFLSSLGPKYQKYLRWKKQLTILQLVQFVIILIFSLQTLARECEYPKMLTYLQIIQAITFLYMFTSFYIRTYLEPKQAKEA